MLELRQRADRRFRGGEAQVQQVVDGLRQPRGQNEIAIVRQPPHGELEGRAILRFPGLEIAGSHGELVKIGVESRTIRAGGPLLLLSVFELPEAAVP